MMELCFRSNAMESHMAVLPPHDLMTLRNEKTAFLRWVQLRNL